MSRRNKISEPPEKVKEILAIVYLLPPDTNLPKFSDLYFKLLTTDPDARFSNLKEAYGIEEDEDDEDSEYYSFRRNSKESNLYEQDKKHVDTVYRVKALENCLIGLPSQFIDYVDSPKGDLQSHFEKFKSWKNKYNVPFEMFVRMAATSDTFLEGLLTIEAIEASRRYEDARDCYIRLYNLMNFFERWKREEGNIFSRHEDKHELFAIKDITFIDNKVIFLPDKFTEAFNGVDMNRLKLCGNCGRVFWVKRFDMKGCSIACAKVLRTRKWREKTTEGQRASYKVNRIEKELKKQRKQKDGTL